MSLKEDNKKRKYLKNDDDTVFSEKSENKSRIRVRNISELANIPKTEIIGHYSTETASTRQDHSVKAAPVNKKINDVNAPASISTHQSAVVPSLVSTSNGKYILIFYIMLKKV